MKSDFIQNKTESDKQHLFSGSDSLMTVDEASSRLKVSSEQVRNLIRQGHLSAINVGIGTKRPLYRITSEALEIFIHSRRHSTDHRPKRKSKQLAPTPDFFPHLK